MLDQDRKREICDSAIFIYFAYESFKPLYKIDYTREEVDEFLSTYADKVKNTVKEMNLLADSRSREIE